MGYWIIVILIILGGVLVLIAATTVDSDVETEKQSDQTRSLGHAPANRSKLANEPDRQVPLVVFTPRLWLQGDHSFPELGIPGVATDTQPVRSSKISDVAAAAESLETNLVDSITVVLVGADDFLAGNSLETVLSDLDRLLGRISAQPAMAVVGSMPDIGPELSQTLTGVSTEAISASIALWNNAIADIVQSYSAEFVDLGSVPVRLVDVLGKIPGMTLSATPDLRTLIAPLAQACNLAADRVRSIRAET